MAMFLSRIKKALNLGTKSITVNGTYNASSDGYDGYSSVEVNVPQITPTSITPSNASPVALTSGNAVSPTANGYAIESYSEVVPSNVSPVTLSNGSIYKIKTNGGKAVASITDITPDDTNPPSVSSGDILKAGGAGYLYATQQSGDIQWEPIWTNTAPTTAVTTKSVSFAISYWDRMYIRIKFRKSTSNSSEMSMVYKCSDVKNQGSSSNQFCAVSPAILDSNANRYVRYISFTYSNASISNATRIGNSNTNTSLLIPLEIAFSTT